MSYADKFTEGQRVQCIDADGGMQVNVGDKGTVVSRGQIKLDHNGYVGGWWHRRFKEIEEVTTKFQVGQRIIVTRETTWAQGLSGVITGNKTSSSGNFMGYLVTFDDNTKNIHGDRVFWYDHELALEAKETMTLKEAMKLCIDGHKVQPAVVKDNANHMYFDGKEFMYYAKGTSGHTKADGVLRQDQWKIYVEPPTPKFTPKQLVQNDSGTLGIIMEYKGDLRYSVRFSGLKGGAVKTMEEAELAKVDL